MQLCTVSVESALKVSFLGALVAAAQTCHRAAVPHNTGSRSCSLTCSLHVHVLSRMRFAVCVCFWYLEALEVKLAQMEQELRAARGGSKQVCCLG